MQLARALPLIVLAVLYSSSILIQILILGTEPGPAYALREIVKGVLCVGIAYLLLHKSGTITLQVKRPKLETLLGLLTVALTLAVLYLYWASPQFLFPQAWVRPIYNVIGVSPSVFWVVLALIAIPVSVWILGKYNLKDVGLRIPKIRHVLTWLVTFTIAVTLVFLLALSYGGNFLQHYFSDLISLENAKWLFLAYLPEELLFRVYLQTRLVKIGESKLGNSHHSSTFQPTPRATTTDRHGLDLSFSYSKCAAAS